MDNRRTRKHHCGLFRRIAPLAVAFGLSGVWTGQALAALKTYTGCLNLARGYFTKVAEGAAPVSACTLGQTQVTLSGGDITDVATPAAGGLLGGTDNGAASLSLNVAFRLPQACASGQLPKWNGASWVCAAAGAGLAKLEDLQGLPCNNGADAGTVSVAINPASHVVSLACPRLGQFQLTVAAIGAGTIESTPPGIDCGSGQDDCSQSHQAGEIVTLAETHPADQVSFLGWGGACSGPSSTCQVTMDQARLVTATFQPLLTLKLVTTASSRDISCAFSICVFVDSFTDSGARVTVFDSDASATIGACDADTSFRNVVAQSAPPSIATTTCNIPVPAGHHVQLQADDKSALGGTQTFLQWADGPCAGSSDATCSPAAGVAGHEETTALFN